MIYPQTGLDGPINKTFCKSNLLDKLSEDGPGSLEMPQKTVLQLGKGAASRASGARGGRRAHGGGLPPPDPPPLRI